MTRAPQLSPMQWIVMMEEFVAEQHRLPYARATEPHESRLYLWMRPVLRGDRPVPEAVWKRLTALVDRTPKIRKPVHQRGFVEANNARREGAAGRAVVAARAALEGCAPQYRPVLTARVQYPQASLAELGDVLGMTKDQYAALLRRAIEASEK